jgi:rhodanese-related sulfurtransferase
MNCSRLTRIDVMPSLFAHDGPTETPDDRTEPARLTVTEAHELVATGRGVLVDTRDRRLFDNAHPAGAVSLPLASIEAAGGRPPADSLPPDRTVILYCA